MPVWKVLLIGALACACLGLASATFVVPFAQDGSQRWVWMGGLLLATLAAGGLLTLFLRHAGRSLGMSFRAARR